MRARPAHRRSQEVTKELSGWRHRLETAEKRSAELFERKGQAEEELATAVAAPTEIAAHGGDALGQAIEDAEKRRQAAADQLAIGETQVREAMNKERDLERAASEAREIRAAAEARTEAAREAVQTAKDRIQEVLETTPEALLENLDTDAERMPPSDQVENAAYDQSSEAASIVYAGDGAVNLRAEEDAREVEHEHAQLLNEKTDLEEAIKALRGGIASLNREGRERLLTAFEQVNENFGNLFKHLFGGGEANLVLVESEDPLDAGLEIMCQPPGKKLATLSLLSGGGWGTNTDRPCLDFCCVLGKPCADLCVGRG